jgi:hypothetical protein
MRLTMDDTALLERIRDHYRDIHLLTLYCCSEISPDAIPEMIRARADLMNMIAAQERLLPDEYFGIEKKEATRQIQEEIKAVIEKIIDLDQQVEAVIESNLNRIKFDIASLQTTSKAASAYTLQSRK